MNARREFPKAVKVAAIKRATKYGMVICEACGAMAKGFEIDHARADGLLGEPTLANAVILCRPCHAEKTKGDVAAIAEAKRREAAHVGARRPKVPLKSGAKLAGPEKAHEGRGPSVGLSNFARRFPGAFDE